MPSEMRRKYWAGVESAADTELPSAPIETSVATHPQWYNQSFRAVRSTASATTLDDEGWSIKNALFALLALRLNQSIESLSQTDTIDDLGGNSARRNQILLDLGKEFGVGAIDGAHELPLGELSGN